MRKYYGEVANEANWERYHRVITVEAENVQAAFDLIMAEKKADEDIYQISRDFEDCECAQPVYDFFNSFSYAGSEATAKTWAEHWNVNELCKNN